MAHGGCWTSGGQTGDWWRRRACCPRRRRRGASVLPDTLRVYKMALATRARRCVRWLPARANGTETVCRMEVAGSDADSVRDPFPLSKGSRLEGGARQAALANDRQECPDGDPGVIGNRHGDGGLCSSALHDDVAATSSNLAEAVLFQDPADL